MFEYGFVLVCMQIVGVVVVVEEFWRLRPEANSLFDVVFLLRVFFGSIGMAALMGAVFVIAYKFLMGVI